MSIGTGWQRVIAGAVIVPAAALTLPVAATFLDHPPGRENWILPAAAVGSLGIGAGVGALLPKIAGSGASHLRGAALGAGVGLAAAALGTALLFFDITDR
ncbi:MAG: hypothetical protein JWM98_1489 [Thermoleophilia bacterium]|nr:hypothetical protein [Thermoleophilia bacterium]